MSLTSGYGGGEDDDKENLSNSSLIDYHLEEYEELAAIESKDSESSFCGYDNSFIPLSQESYKDNGAEDKARGRRCEGDRCHKADPEPELLSESESSYCE
ncbi:hypothetical protein C5167_025728 [Papaver somniferum]|uniref:Uncharacterized protein n=1 Tax=Papaver somniferum TaxID=3469 RepID=A0A4Y7JS97_PAPSO|nr:hypothetical protein C5167_025728 [Papaver somniferum]